MCCGSCLLLFWKIADTFIEAQRRENARNIEETARDLERRVAELDPFATSSSDSDSDSDAEYHLAADGKPKQD